MASEEEMQQEDTVQLREHGNMMNRPLVVGVLFESDEWSDHKLGAEISSALKTTLPNITHDVRLINMQQANSVDAALGMRCVGKPRIRECAQSWTRTGTTQHGCTHSSYRGHFDLAHQRTSRPRL